MSREASGTSWQPDAVPMEGRHVERGPWRLMTHAQVNAVYADAEGPRGELGRQVESMFMLMAHRPAAAGTLGLRAMLSLDPWLVGRNGYPLLLQTGETADGRTPLIDRQHPHDLLMELAASYSIATGAAQSLFVYGGLPGEPALGPVTYMHRYSGRDNPEAPLGHHWLDATHISFGVLTAGYVWQRWKLEASLFNGREPDQHRRDLETGALSSWSARLSFNPSANWSLQISQAAIESPEALEPELDLRRSTVSLTYHRPLPQARFEATLAIGRNDPSEGPGTDAALLEAAWALRERNTVFARLERVDKDELFQAGEPLAGRVFTVDKLSLGVVHDWVSGDRGRVGLGAQYSHHVLPDALGPAYGGDPDSWLLFARWRR